jgi:hypothetical protein
MDEKQTTESGHPQGCFVCGTMKPFLHNLWSDATKGHFRNSRLEFLKGIRSLIDDRIERLARHDAKGERVTVE